MQTTLAPRAGRREWAAFSVLMLPLLLVSMDVSVLYFALPYVGQDLQPSATQQLWILDMYSFVLSGLLIAMGSVGDRVGRRALVIVGAALFGVASLAAAYSDSAEMLIATRALLGIGGAALMPSTLALIRALFLDEKQRATAVTLWTTIMTVGISLGPVVSGVLLQHFWWGSVFLINLPAMLLLLVLAPLLLPEVRPGGGRFDWLSAGLSLAAMLPFVQGVKELARDGYAPLPAVGVTFGVVMGIVFLYRQRRMAHPMVDLKLLGQRAYGISVLANLLAIGATVGFAVFLSQYLQSVLEMRPLTAALWTLVPAVGVLIAAPLGGVLAQKVDRSYVMGGGFIVSACGFAMLTQVTPDSPLWYALTASGVYAGGLVAAMTLANELALGAAPPERAGSAAAVLESGHELGAAFGMALLGTIGAAVYTDAMSGAPTEAARETLSGALATAGALPAAQGDSLRTAAEQAFTDGLDWAAGTSSGLMICAALLSLFLLRGIKRSSDSPAAEGGHVPVQPGEPSYRG
ncbi:MFS transporter [Streptomyces sp. NPDC051921]|uniref:MFS transporter n=1 Tax=Streptomyces sp. NPDC051921 TaxID=3155806 RepID=UPI0034364772